MLLGAPRAAGEGVARITAVGVCPEVVDDPTEERVAGVGVGDAGARPALEATPGEHLELLVHWHQVALIVVADEVDRVALDPERPRGQAPGLLDRRRAEGLAAELVGLLQVRASAIAADLGEALGDHLVPLGVGAGEAGAMGEQVTDGDGRPATVGADARIAERGDLRRRIVAGAGERRRGAGVAELVGAGVGMVEVAAQGCRQQIEPRVEERRVELVLVGGGGPLADPHGDQRSDDRRDHSLGHAADPHRRLGRGDRRLGIPLVAAAIARAGAVLARGRRAPQLAEAAAVDPMPAVGDREDPGADAAPFHELAGGDVELCEDRR